VTPRRRPRPRGFTLLEVSIAITLLALTVTFVYQILWNAVRLKDAVREGLEGPSVEQAILDQIMRDFRYVYYRAGQLPADAGFWGRSKQIGGRDADRVDFLTCRSSKVATLEDADQPTGDSPVSEAGYALRANDADARWLGLWRREDYFVDDDPTDGGRFDLLYDKVRSFELRYFPVPEENRDVKGLEEWDSKVQKKIPYAMILRLEYDLHAPAADEPQGRIVKVLVLRSGRSLPPDAGMGMDTGMTSMGM
jgi:prepilin-type N-terminal cleavage/methylation domain-containing protein